MKLSEVEKYVETKEPLMLFVDRHGGVDGVSLRHGQFDNETDVFQRLLEMANHAGPYFEICTVINGVIQDQAGDMISTDDLPALLKNAEAERVRFYSEREQVYGASAWPVSV